MTIKISFFDVMISVLFLSITTLSIYYFSIGISIEDVAPSFNLMLFVLLLGFVSTLALLLKGYAIFFKKSSVFFALFLTYLLFRIAFDMHHFQYIKGLIVYYLLGVFLSVLVNYLTFESKKYNAFKVVVYLVLYIFSIVFSLILVAKLPEIMAEMRSDTFLVKGRYFDYQAPGRALVFMCLIYAFVFNFLSVTIKRKMSLMYIFIYLLFIVNFIASMFLSQILGSNNALVHVAGLLMATIIFQLFLSSDIKKRLSIKLFRLSNIFKSKILYDYLKTVFYGLITFLLILLAVVFAFDIDINKFRIFSFGTGEIASLDSRLRLLDNFVIHLDYSPVFGNMNVENLTTGVGTYVHSFIASLFTHTGLFGGILFFAWLLLAIKEKITTREAVGEKRFFENSLSIYSLTIFIGLFIIATVGVFFIRWVPIWFSFGFIFSPIVLRKKVQACT